MGKNVIGGATNVQVTLKIVDDTSGQPETGVVYNTTGIDLWYRREGAVSVDITEAVLGHLTWSHSDGGFLHINDGVYRLDVPDAAFAAGVASVYIGGAVPGMVVLGTEIHLDAVADQVWDASVSAHTSYPSFGYYGIPPAATLIADAVWNEATSGHSSAGTYGLAVADVDTATSSLIIRTNTAQAGGTPTITLDSGASSIEFFYNDTLITIVGGTGIGQSRTITNYVGTTRVATVGPAWRTNPDSTSVFVILPQSTTKIIPSDVTFIADAIWDEARGSHTLAGTFGLYLDQAVSTAGGDSASVVADAVWNEATSGHSSGGTYGLAVADIDTSTANATSTAATIADAVWDELKSAHTIADSFGDYLDDEISSRSDFNELLNPVELLNSGGSAGTSAAELVVDMAVPTTAAINTEVDTAIADALDSIADAVWDEVQSGHTTSGTFGLYLDQTVSTGGGGASASAIADAVWDELKSAHTIADSFGDYLDDEISSRSDFDETANPVELLNSGGSAGTSAAELVVDMAVPTTAAINAEVDTALADAKAGYVDAIWDEATSGHSSGGTYGLAVADIDTSTANATPTAATIADAVWDEVQSGHTTSGTFGLYLDQTVSTGGGGASASVIADAVWNEATSGHVSAGSFGLAVGDTDTATGLITLAAINTEVDTAIADAEAGLVDAIWDENVVSAHDTADTAGKLLEDTAATVATNLNAQVSGIDTTTIPTVAQIADGVWDELQAGHTTTDTFGEYLDSIISDIATGTPPSAAAVANAVWDEVQSGHTTSGTFGLYLDQTVSTVGGGDSASVIADAVWNEATSGHSSGGTYGLAVADIDTSTANATPTAVTIADAVWDEVQSGHTTGGTFGLYLDAIVSAIDTTTTPTVVQIADGVWDEAASGHVTSGTTGELLRDGHDALVVRRNTAQTGAAGTIKLDASASATNDLYNDSLIVTVGGTGAGQARTITDYVGSSKVATITPNWTTTPDATTVFLIIPSGSTPVEIDLTADSTAIAAAVWDEATSGHTTGGTYGLAVADIDTSTANATPTVATIADAVWDEVQSGHTTGGTFGLYLDSVVGSIDTTTTPTVAQIADGVWDEALSGHQGSGAAGEALQDTHNALVIRNNTAQAGTSGTLQLDASASSVNDFYNDCLVLAVSGTGAGQARLITDYVGSTTTATVEPNWVTTPDATTVFEVVANGRSQIVGTKERLDDLQDLTAAQVNTEADSAISDAFTFASGDVHATLDGETVTASSVTDKTGYTLSAAGIDAIWDEATSGHSTGGTFAVAITEIDTSTANATPTVAQIADALWDEATSGHTTGGSYGKAVADIDTSTANATPTVAAISDAVWDEVQSGHTTPSTFGLYLDSIVSGANTTTPPTVSAIADAVWDETTSGHSGAGTAGLALTDIDTASGAASTHSASDVWAVGTRDITGGTIDTVGDKTGYALSTAGIDAIWDEDVVAAHGTADTAGKLLNDTASTVNTNLNATVSSRSSHTAANVWASGTRTLTDLTGFALSSAGVDAVSDGVWDEDVSTHQTSGTAGELLQDMHDAIVLRNNTAQSAASGTIRLDTGASSVNDFYNDCFVMTVSGTGSGQVRLITDYVGSTTTATVEPNWVTTPDVTTVFQVIFNGRSQIVGTKERLDDLQDLTTAQVNTEADSAISDAFTFTGNDVHSTLDGETVTASSVTDKTGYSLSTAGVDAIWDEPIALHTDAGSFGEQMQDIDTASSAASTHSASDVWSVVTRALTDKSGFALSTAGIDSILNEPLSGHATTGTLGDAIQQLVDTNVFRENTAQSATSTTIRLDTNASSVDDFYNNCFVVAVSGTGAGQIRRISDYVGSTTTATVATWITTPDNTTVFIIVPFSTLEMSLSVLDHAAISDSVWDEDVTDHQTADSAGKALFDINASTAGIGTATITIVNPVADTGDINVVKGDDYLSTDARQLAWDSTGWPNLTSATITFTMNERGGGTDTFTKTGTVTTAGDSSQTVRVEPTSIDTATFNVGFKQYDFDVQAVLSNSSIITLVRGKVTVETQQT